MRSIRLNVIGLLTLTAVAGTAVMPLYAQVKAPLDAYKAYLDAASKATKPDALFPFVSKEYKSLLEKAPKAEVEKMLKMHIAKDKLSELVVTSQKVDASKAVFELTAKTADGRPAQGKVNMVKEAGAWKLDEDAWAVPPKKQ
jgi:hypothetical protein